MPRPGYILCAASGALDEYTNIVSLFGIAEAIQFQNVQAVPGIVTTVRELHVRIVATWFRGEGDADDGEFQAQIVGHFPQQEAPLVLAEFAPFRFVHPLHRIIVPEITFPPILAPGFLRIECRLRRREEDVWNWSQSNEILVLEEAISGPTPPAQPHADPGQRA